MTLWSRGLAKSRDKLKSLHHQYHSAYGRQTWQGDDLPYGISTYKAIRFFSLVVLQDHVLN